MARVTIENEARKDPRFKRLGKLLAPRLRPSLQQALGIGVMDSIWDYMTERFKYPRNAQGKEDASLTPAPAMFTISRTQLEDITDDPDMAGHLVAAELAEPADDGNYRIRGTTVKRIGWLARLRVNGSNGGRPKKGESKAEPPAKAKPNQMVSSGESQAEPGAKAEPNPPTPALVLTPALKEREIPPPPPGTAPSSSRLHDAHFRVEDVIRALRTVAEETGRIRGFDPNVKWARDQLRDEIVRHADGNQAGLDEVLRRVPEFKRRLSAGDYDEGSRGGIIGAFRNAYGDLGMAMGSTSAPSTEPLAPAGKRTGLLGSRSNP